MAAEAILKRIWQAGIDAVGGRMSVARELARGDIPAPNAIVAVGKAAAEMAAAAVAAHGEAPTLVVTKYGHAESAGLPPHARVIEAAHPVPDAQSLEGGRALLDMVGGLGDGAHLLLLVSGGASALAEVPEDGLTLNDLAARNRALLSEGLDIHAMNRQRRQWSRVKGGRLLEAFGGARVTMLAISDVEGDDIGVIGSGIGACPAEAGFTYDGRIVASNAIARDAMADEAGGLGIPVLSNDESLHGPVEAAAARVLSETDDRPGLRIWGGETTVILPPDPGEGGRNQALALMIARGLAGRPGITVIAAGTDGTDGPTTAAGGLVTGETWGCGGEAALAAADSGRFLRDRGALFVTGPTGTNVMDVVLALNARGPGG